jgi:hypothetical protein
MTPMNIDEAIGYYTYRSFLNRPVGAPNDILWGEAELFLLISDEGNVTGTLAFPADTGAAQKDFMDLRGTVTAWAPLAFRFVGKGRAGSAIAEYEYEYDCRVAHEWDTAAPPQRRSLVGTVRRIKDHGQAKAGATASFIAVQRDFVEPRAVPGVALIPEAVAMLADRVHRLRHTVWHTLRGDWYSDKMTDADRDRLKKLRWHLADPPFRPDGVLDLTNGAGEDFLYMHRRMIRMVHDVYDKAGKPRPTSWAQLPPFGAPQFAYKEAADPVNPTVKTYVYDPDNSGVMVPPPTCAFLEQVRDPETGDINPFFRFNKTARGLTNLMRNLATNLRNPRVLSQLTLGAYGNLIEFTVHNWMHMRWASAQPRDPQTGKPVVRGDYDIDAKKWDIPDYDYLGDFHSSHVNPIFWKLHGWVDDCIGVWHAAHDTTHPGQVKTHEVRGIPWYAPGPWVLKADPFDWPGAGGSHGHGQGGGHGGHAGDEQKTLEEVMAILKEVNDRPQVTTAFAELAGVRRHLPGFARFSVPESGE